ncbi:MAG: glycosyltransferase 87 family protein, partial [Pseudomonadota bacterium]
MVEMSAYHGRGLAILGAMLIAGCAAFTLLSDLYSYDYYVMMMPIRGLILSLLAAGVLYLAAAGLLLDAVAQADPRAQPRRLGAPPERAMGDLVQSGDRLLIGIFLVGLACRCILLASEPALEDDYQRYLWDGAVTAAGLNPFAVSPEAAQASTPPSIYAALASQSGVVLERVNHPELRSIYPPVAQAGFAIAHWLAPFSLYAWKVVCLAADVATFWLLLALLRAVAQPAALVLLYWWNPVVLKELFNSAHMEALLVPLVLGALLAAVSNRHLLGSILLALAAGVKVWPVLLLPLLWIGLLNKPVRLLAAMTVTALLLVLLALPIVLAGLNDDSGFVAYAKEWQTNSALFPALVAGAISLFGETLAVSFIGMSASVPTNSAVRAMLAASAGISALAMAAWYWRRRSYGSLGPLPGEDARLSDTAQNARQS